MRWNPVFNALGAVTYIGAVVLFMQFIESVSRDTPDTPLAGMAALSLLVFSAAVMAFLFFYQPMVLLIESKKKEALSYFSKTLGIFGVITLCVLIFISFW